ncbi:MAG: helix-turn-helix domain-containing protein [Spirochaetia bacterium]|nr:helix-turn-helix domain-containing protein [Spirochaetia bacterium]MCF7946929.1 helix-turn-helix domain-containing protein [Spirochaetia bacterium]MCF7953399.1 helix-turn-helix domain-containing protein [Spirochaetales bacterium]
MKIHYSSVLEGLGFLYSYVKLVMQKEEETTVPVNSVIDKWLKEIDSQISTFLKNDIQLLFSSMSINNWVLFFLVHSQGCKTSEELISHIENMDAASFADLYKTSIKLEDVPFEKITKKIIRKSIEQEYLHVAEGQDTYIYQLMENPTEWKERITRTYAEFQKRFFIPRETEILNKTEKIAAESQKKIDKEPTAYLDTISAGHYKTSLKERADIKIYASFTFDREIFISLDMGVIWFGLQREKLFEDVSRKSKTDLLFKILSDPKRLEILRLISRRTWYSNELAKHFNLTSATMSYHLNKLLNAGLLTFEVGEQNKIYYRVNSKTLIDLMDAARHDLLAEQER